MNPTLCDEGSIRQLGGVLEQTKLPVIVRTNLSDSKQDLERCVKVRGKALEASKKP